MLQNQTYLGKVKYQQTLRNSDRSRSYSAPIEWFDGQHEPLISHELFDRCQEVRRNRAVHRQATPKYVPYLLRGLVYCYRCCTSQPQEVPFPAFGKMRCQAKDCDQECAQGAVKVDDIDAQVVSVLKNLKPPEEWRKNITRAMSEILGEQNLEERLAEIHEAIERMDFRWDQGFITDKNDYLEKRVKLQQELEHLTPVADDDLEVAADMLANFGEHWDACGGDTEKEHELVKLIIERVYVQEDQVVAMTLKANYHFVLGQNAKGPTAISVDPSVYTSGSDGI